MLLWLLLACPPPEPEFCPDQGSVCRLVGTGQLGFNGEDLPALESWLYWPTSVRFDAEQRLHVVDFNNMRIRRLEEDGTLHTIAGSGEHAWSTPGATILDSALENPIEVAFAPEGGFYIAALHEARILYVSPDGSVRPFAGSGEYGLAGDGGPADQAAMSEAAGIALAPDGSLYIADTQNHCLRVVDPQGIIHTLAGNGLAGYAGDGQGLETAMFNSPQQLEWYDGAVYIADTYNHAIRRLDPESGSLTTVAGTGMPGYSGDGGKATDAQLHSPYGLGFGSDGTMYIADTDNSVVRQVSPDGIIRTVAGNGTVGLEGDGGPALDASFNWPGDVVVDPEGNLVIADMRNGMLRFVRMEE